MQMKLKQNIFLFAFTAVMFFGCHHDQPVAPTPTLPAATQTGENTFGCLVDGQVWLPKGGGLIQTVSCDYYNPPALVIHANKAQGDAGIVFSFSNVQTTGNYTLNDSMSGQTVEFFRENVIFICDSLVSGNLAITKLDTVNKIISGTFYFDAINGSQRVLIRDGRFDLKYN